MNYEKKYLKYKLKYLNLKALIGGMVRTTGDDHSIRERELELERELREQDKHHLLLDDINPITDHYVMRKTIGFAGKRILILNLNIAQRYSIKLDTANDQYFSFLRSKRNFGDASAIIAALKNELLVSNSKSYNKHRADIKKTSRGQERIYHKDITGSHEGQRIKDILTRYRLPTDEIQILLRKSREDFLGTKAREYPEGFHIDVIFKEETADEYKTRIRVALDYLSTLAHEEENVLIFIQENNPLETFLQAFNESTLRTTSGFSHLESGIVIGPTDKVRTSSEVLYKFTDKTIRILNITPEVTGGKITPGIVPTKITEFKGPRQNWSFILNIDGHEMRIYNVHANMLYGRDGLRQSIDKLERAGKHEKAVRESEKHSSGLAFELCRDEIIPKLLDREKEAVMFIGDFNFGITENDITELRTLFTGERGLYSYFLPTPEAEYREPEVALRTNPTCDCLFARGIRILS